MDGSGSVGGGDGGSFATSTDAGSPAAHTSSGTDGGDSGAIIAATAGATSGNNSKSPHNKNKYFALWVVVLILLGASAVLAFWSHGQGDSGGVTACTEEAKICPDGSSVGRTGPNCEFTPCPEVPSVPVPIASGGIKGVVMLGPSCPVMSEPPDPKCADKPYATNLVVTTADQSRVMAEFSSDASGNFSVKVPPGEYAIRSAGAASVLPYCANTATIRVDAGGYANATIYCDTGIR